MSYQWIGLQRNETKPMDQTDLILRLGLSIAVGFLIGLERGWRERDEEEGHRTAGLRTFTLIGLMGGIFGALSTGGNLVLLAAGFVTLGATVGRLHVARGPAKDDLSATSLVAAMLTFVLGAYAVLGDLQVAAGAGVATVILLANKEFLHEWLTRISWPELRSGLLLAAMTFVLLPLLPDRTIDPWNVLNPHALWLMTILIAAVSFGGYAVVKLAGPKSWPDPCRPAGRHVCINRSDPLACPPRPRQCRPCSPARRRNPCFGLRHVPTGARGHRIDQSSAFLGSRTGPSRCQLPRWELLAFVFVSAAK